MDQKNTIVKCKAHPNCLFNHNGVCDNYVINIGTDGKCECYVETAIEDRVSCYECNYFADDGQNQCPCDKHEQYVYRTAPACGDFKAKRGQRAKCNFVEDGWVDPEIVKEVCQPFTMSDHLCDISCTSATYAEDGELYCSLIQDYPERPLRCSAYDDGGCDCAEWDKSAHNCKLPKCCWR